MPLSAQSLSFMIAWSSWSEICLRSSSWSGKRLTLNGLGLFWLKQVVLRRIKILLLFYAVLDPRQTDDGDAQPLQLRFKLLLFPQVKNDHIDLLALLNYHAGVVFYLGAVLRGNIPLRNYSQVWCLRLLVGGIPRR